MPIKPAQPPKFTKVARGGLEYSVELNDANLEASSWKNPRYSGCQTKTKVLNKYDINDITFGKTAAAQKYSRNIYFGNAVIGLSGTPEDTRLMRIENFSYIQTNKFFTINDDDTISVQRLETTKGENDSKNGFYRSFYEDFKEGSDCRLIIADDSIKTSLLDRYNIYFNGGALRKLFSYRQPAQSPTSQITFPNQQQTLRIREPRESFDGGIQFYNENDIRKFYTGSLDAYVSPALDELLGNFVGGGVGSILDGLGDLPGLSNNVDNFEAISDRYFDPFFEYRDNSDYKGDKRLFLTFCTESNISSTIPGNNIEAIRTIDENTTPPYDGTLHKTENLPELLTSEIVNIDFAPYFFRDTEDAQALRPGQQQIYTLSNRYLYNFAPNPNFGAETPAVRHCHTLITVCDDSVPSLLLNLPKEEHLPDGIGRKGFIIVPENIHPHIKQNLVHFLARAGVSLGTDVVPAIDNTYRKLM